MVYLIHRLTTTYLPTYLPKASSSDCLNRGKGFFLFGFWLVGGMVLTVTGRQAGDNAKGEREGGKGNGMAVIRVAKSREVGCVCPSARLVSIDMHFPVVE